MKLIRRLLARIPTKLPQGITAFNDWANDILYLYDIPNNDSTHFALATSIMHLGATNGYMPKDYFGRTLLKGAATQVAYQVMQDCKTRQEEKAKAEALAATQPAEATAPTAVASDDKSAV